MAGINWEGGESEGKKGPFAVLGAAYLINSNTDPIQLCRGKLREVWVVLWRHMVEFQDCRQTWSANLPKWVCGWGGFTCALCLPAMLCKVFIQNTKLHLPAHVKEGTGHLKGEHKPFQLQVIMRQTHEHLFIPIAPKKAVVSLFYSYFKLFEQTIDLRNTASALPDLVACQATKKMTLTRPLVF